MIIKILLFLLPVALAVPLAQIGSSELVSRSTAGYKLPPGLQGCQTANIPITLPSGLSIPNGQSISLITVGRGIQNYTCTNGAYVSIGALAK